MFAVFCLLGIICALLIVRLLCFKGPMRSPVSPPPTGILDMHCHAAGFGAGESGAWVSPALRNSWKFNLYLKILVSEHKCEDLYDVFSTLEFMLHNTLVKIKPNLLNKNTSIISPVQIRNYILEKLLYRL